MQRFTTAADLRRRSRAYRAGKIVLGVGAMFLILSLLPPSLVPYLFRGRGGGPDDWKFLRTLAALLVMAGTSLVTCGCWVAAGTMLETLRRVNHPSTLRTPCESNSAGSRRDGSAKGVGVG